RQRVRPAVAAAARSRTRVVATAEPGPPLMRLSRTSFALLLSLAFGAAALTGLLLGGAHLPLGDAFGAIFGSGSETARTIVWRLRAPRVALGVLVGGVLAVAGASLQALVRNPLADPYLLGLSGGASLGAVLAIAAGLSSVWALPAAAFVGAIVTIAAV